MTKRALITGITGQDGSYLAEFLLAKGYEVHGLVRRVSLEDPSHRLHRISALLDRLHLHPASIESYPSIYRLVADIRPDECYHLAAQSFVSYSLEDELSTLNVNINGTHHILAALKEKSPGTRFYFAGSSEMFGDPAVSPQNEQTPFNPRSPYGISKVAGFYLARNYRQSGLFAANGILYNHESPRRGFEFVTRKISHSVARIKLGLQQTLELGNLDAKRDWGFAAEYVEAMWLMLNAAAPDDYVIATGQAHSVREFMELAFECAGLDWRKHLKIDEKLYRRAESAELKGDSAKAARVLGWRPKMEFKNLVRLMVTADIEKYGKNPGS